MTGGNGMVRSLCSRWKEPIFYNFDTFMKNNILTDIITQLHHAGYTVVSIASNLATSLWSQQKWLLRYPVISIQKIISSITFIEAFEKSFN